MLPRLRLWAVSYLNELADSARQAIAASESLVVDFERVPAPDHPCTLTSRDTRQRPQGGERAGLHRALRGAGCFR